ncbi:MAG: fimbrillin family protein [Marinifilaceae bacterium]
MKKINNYILCSVHCIFTVLFIITLLGFQKEESVIENRDFLRDNVIGLEPVIAGKSLDTTTAGLTEFGFIVANKDVSVHSYSNIKIKRNGNHWIPSLPMQWEDQSVPVGITAYAPYSTEASYHQYPVVLANQSIEANIIASDFVLMHNDNFIPASDLINNKVQVNLAHMMSKLEFRIIINAEFDADIMPHTNPISNITLSGTKLKGQLSSNYSTVELQTLNNLPIPITPYMMKYVRETNHVAEYELILIPQTVTTTDKLEIKFDIGESQYVWSATEDVIFKSGNKYALDLTVEDGIITASRITVSTW